MAIPPGFLKFDGSKWVIDEDIEGSDGDPGADGVTALIYRPGGTEAGNVFASWTNLWAKRITIDSPITIVVDDSITSPAVINSGTYDLNRNTKIEGYRGPSILGSLPRMEIVSGAQFQNPNEFENIYVVGNSSDIPSIVASTAFVVIEVNIRSSVFSTIGSQPLFQVTDDGDDDTTNINVFNLYGESRFYKNGSNTPIVQNDITTDVVINLYDNSILDGYVIRINGEDSNLTFQVHDWGVKYDANQPQTTCNRFVRFPDGSVINVGNSAASDGTVVLGQNNDISGGGARGFYFGEDHVVGAFNYWTVILGGESSTIGSSNTTGAIISSRYSSLGSNSGGDGVFVGASNSASGGQSVVLGGAVNFASGPRAAVVGGANNIASVESAVVVGGNQGSATGLYSVVLGGQQSYTTADNAITMGNRAQGIRTGQLAHGISINNQYSRYISIGSAINGGAIVLGPALNLENGKAYAIRATCIANRTTVANRAMFVNTILAHCTTGTAVIDNNNVTLAVQNGTSWTIAYTVSGANIVATFTATGSGGGSTVVAMVTYEWGEVGGGA